MRHNHEGGAVSEPVSIPFILYVIKHLKSNEWILGKNCIDLGEPTVHIRDFSHPIGHSHPVHELRLDFSSDELWIYAVPLNEHPPTGGQLVFATLRA